MANKKEEKIISDANRAIKYDAKARLSGGYELKHKPSCYGVGLKWLIGIKGLTYSQFGARWNGTSGQNINHFINRVSKERFFEENVERMCEVLNVSFEYFIKLCENIEKLMEN